MTKIRDWWKHINQQLKEHQQLLFRYNEKLTRLLELLPEEQMWKGKAALAGVIIHANGAHFERTASIPAAQNLLSEYGIKPNE